MRVIGIIAEFDPFHNGHEYLIKKAREMTGDPRAVVMCVMSGPFTQRGTPSLLPKHTRAKQALLCGADIILELPFTFACAPSERFAKGAVDLLCKTGVITDLAFGVDCKDPGLLLRLSGIDFEDDEDYRKTLKDCLSAGMNFPAARAAAIKAVLTDEDPELLEDTLRRPNSILALEYLRAVNKSGRKIKVHPVERVGESFDSKDLASSFPSASAIRSFCLQKGITLSDIAGTLYDKMPVRSLAVMLEDLSYKRYKFPDKDLYASFILNAIRDRSQAFAYTGDGLTGHIMNTCSKLRSSDTSFDGLIQNLHTRHFTDGRILRTIASTVTGQTQEIVSSVASAPYIRVLGSGKEGRYCLKIMGRCAKVPIIHNVSDFLEIESSVSESARLVFDLDRRASDIQGMLMGIPVNHDFECPPVIVR